MQVTIKCVRIREFSRFLVGETVALGATIDDFTEAKVSELDPLPRRTS